jgi:IS4 transposase
LRLHATRQYSEQSQECAAEEGARPRWMTVPQYAEFAAAITVREVKVDGQVLLTSLRNPRNVSKGELHQLYARRWEVELDLRNIKTTLGVEVLRCQTPS